MEPMAYKILLVDDEPDILELVGYNLKKEGFEVFTASNGREGVKMAKSIVPDLIVLDVMMPEMDGMEACSVIREDPNLSHCLIAFLTARGEDYSQVAGLDLGGDDYLVKPVKPNVLISKIHALLRRTPAAQKSGGGERFGISIDDTRYLVIQNGQEFSLPRKEFELLKLLWSEPGKVFTREVILSRVWGNDVIVGDRTIDVHIRKLRSRLGDQLFSTIKGVGYKFGQ